ncbi:MAG: hypothetical protein HYX75_21930 [Acidobacteria bacterium]|nr:hypothetical protein [Acidobacteriota bacterium]
MEDNPFLSAQTGIDEIRSLFGERRFQAVIEKASALLKDNPYMDDVRSYYERAVEALNAEPFILEQLKVAEEHFEKGEYLKAIPAARMILDLDSEHPRAIEIMEASQQKVEAEPFVREITVRGLELFERGEFEKARTEWIKIETVDPGNRDLPELLKRCETVLFSKRYSPDVEETIDRLMREGQAHYDEGQFQDAANIWSRILVIDETHQQGQEVVARARRAVEEQQREIDEMLHRARDLHSRGLAEEALDLLDSVLKQSPAQPEAQTLSEQIRFEIEQTELRRKIDAVIGEARSAISERNWSRAMEKVNEALRLQPGNSEAVALSAAIQTGKTKERAEAHYRHALEHQRGGNAYLAFNEVKKALDLDAEHPGAAGLLKELEARLQAEAPVEEELELEPAEEPVSFPSTPSPIPDQPTSLRDPAELAVAAARPAPGWRFLVVSGVILAIGSVLLIFFYLNLDTMFGSINGSAALPEDSENAMRGPLPLPAPGEGYLLRGTQLLENSEPLDAIFYLQKVPPDSPLAKKASALIAKAQQELLELPPPTEVPPPTTGPTPAVSQPSANAEIRKAMAEGRASFSSRNFQLAAQRFSHILDLDAENVDARSYLLKTYYNLGLLALRDSNMGQADSHFRKALEYGPDDQPSQRQLNVIRRYRNQPADHSLQVYLKLQQLRE